MSTFFKGDDSRVRILMLAFVPARNGKRSAGEDLKYLRGLPNAPPGATIFGTAFRFTEPEQLYSKVRLEVPEVGERVTIQGTTQRYEVLVDDSGNFNISGSHLSRFP